MHKKTATFHNVAEESKKLNINLNSKRTLLVLYLFDTASASVLCFHACIVIQAYENFGKSRSRNLYVRIVPNIDGRNFPIREM
jgi:hypothetical protein